MWKRVLGVSLLGFLVSVAPASAQRLEVSGIFGWTLSDGVDGDGILAGDGNFYNEVSPKDSGSWGFSVGYITSEQFEVGFLYGQQNSSMEVSGTNTVDVGDWKINTYHGYFGYNFGDGDSVVRPYVMIGFGATHYGNVDFTAGGQPRSTGGETQFSTTWGAGVKAFPSSHFGVRAGVQWTPTYIKSDAEGWWCDPWWGCYVVGDTQYSNQFQFSGGVTARF